MGKFTVDVERRGFVPTVMGRELVLTPSRWAWSDQGGPSTAEVMVSGPVAALAATLDWILRPVRIYNEYGSAVWWGYVAGVAYRRNLFESGKFVEGMANRVNVLYSYSNPDGQAVTAETGWASDATSVAEYGTWELRYSMGNVSAEVASRLRETLLATLANPNRSQGSAGRERTAQTRLICLGWWQSLGATYYSNLAGLERNNASSGTAIPLGVAFSSAEIGFETNNRAIHDIQSRLGAFAAGNKVHVAGSASNNGDFTIARGTTREAVTYTASTISFTAPNLINDSAAGFDFADANDLINVYGSTSNNGYCFVASMSARVVLTMQQSTITTEAAGAGRQLTRGTQIEVESTMTTELPGSTVTLTVHGEKVAQKFTLAVNADWPAYEIVIRLRKMGSPSDAVTVELCADSAGAPGSVLASGSVAAASIYTSMNWVTATLGTQPTLSYGTNYWIVVRRSGSSHYSNYYEIDVDEGGQYSLGALKVWSGAAWVDPANVADLLFAVWGKQEITAQVQKIVQDEGQFLTGCDVLDTAGVVDYQYREGANKAKAEAEGLLGLNSASGQRLLATVTADRRVVVSRAPLLASAGMVDRVRLDTDGKFYDAVGTRLEPGVLPVAKWCDVMDEVGEPAFWVRAAEYDAATGEIRYFPLGATGVGELTKVRQG